MCSYCVCVCVVNVAVCVRRWFCVWRRAVVRRAFGLCALLVCYVDVPVRLLCVCMWFVCVVFGLALWCLCCCVWLCCFVVCGLRFVCGCCVLGLCACVVCFVLLLLVWFMRVCAVVLRVCVWFGVGVLFLGCNVCDGVVVSSSCVCAVLLLILCSYVVCAGLVVCCCCCVVC